MEITHLSAVDVLASLGSGESGLDDAEVRKRQREFGPNRIEEIRAAPLWLRLLREFTHFFALILWVAAGLAFFAERAAPGGGMFELGVAILGVIAVNGLFSFAQEYRAERAVAALRGLLPAVTKVVRNAELTTVPADTLVPGDLILLAEGDNVPADCRLIQAASLRASFATLTGESHPLTRTPEACGSENHLDARNLLLAGTSVVGGRGRAVVYATGMRTEFGRIARLTQTVGEAGSPLQREIARLSRFVAVLASALGLVFFGLGIAVGLPFWHSAMFAIGIIVANVPEGLLPTVTLSLAMATQRMAKRRALVRHLPSVETLGSTTVICSDKTGTLTQNSMAVMEVYTAALGAPTTTLERVADDAHLRRNLRLCHDLRRGKRDGRAVWLGDPMEIALQEFGQRGPPGTPESVVEETPFDSDRRRMSVVVQADGRRWLYCKGAPEAVLGSCTTIVTPAGPVAFDEALRARVVEAQVAMAERGLRVLGFAHRELLHQAPTDERGLEFAGLVGLRDPPRPEVPDAVARCRTAGIRVVMVTGDHPRTAEAIAREIGLVRSERPLLIHGDRLRQMTDEQLRIELDAEEVLCTRVTAEQKLRIVLALKAKGHVVAVTGDGVNDAPALKAADIGVAMGVTGTDVAKEAADMVLLDDNFASIVDAIEEGRAVYRNIRHFLTYILTSNVPELVPYLAFVLFRIPLPLTVIQILAVDLGTDMLPALALGAEPPGQGSMQQPPRAAGERLLAWHVLVRAYLWLGLLQAGAAMAAYFFVLHLGGWHYGDSLAAHEPLYRQATTACLAAIVLAQVVNVFACRDPRQSMLRIPLRSNPLLLQGVAVELVLLGLLVYSAPGQAGFGTAPLPGQAWIAIAALAVGFGALEELRKALLRARESPGRVGGSRGFARLRLR